MHPLDNAIWTALTTRQAHLGRSERGACKFHGDVSILGGLADPGPDGYAALARLVEPGEQVGLLVEQLTPTPGFELVVAASVIQMVRDTDQPLPAPETAPAFVALGDADVPEMIALTELTKPGPFARRTHEMGDYIGLRSDGHLIAMVGERMRVPGYTEISAVCTHPDHLGRGYARALMAVAIHRSLARGERSFLHVRPENTRAVALYEHLGFAQRHERQYVILRSPV